MQIIIIIIIIIIMVLKSRRKRWAGHVAHMRELKNEYKILSENLKGRYHLEDLGIDEKIILDWISGGKRMERCEVDASGSGQGPAGGSSEHGNEISGSIKDEEFLD
jgi:hypothetical protein